jgi:hypothetical protein
VRELVLVPESAPAQGLESVKDPALAQGTVLATALVLVR